MNAIQPYRKPPISRRLLCACWLGLWLLGAGQALALELPPVRVLVIESFAADSPLSMAFNHALAKHLERSPRKVELDIQSIDTHRFNDASSKAAHAQYIKHRYAQAPPDYLLASDRSASAFILTELADFYPDTALISLGTAEGDLDAAGVSRQIHNVTDKPDFLGNMRLIRQLLPDVRQLVVVGDTGLLRRDLERAMDTARQEFAVVSDLSLVPETQALERLAQLPPDSAVLIGGYLLDDQGQRMDLNETTTKVVSVAPVPTFGTVDMGPDNGLVGGKMVSPTGRARAIADMLLQLIAGDYQARPDQRTNYQALIFDHAVLQRFGLEGLELPPGSVVRNLPMGIFDTNPRLTFAALFLALVLLLVVMYLLMRFYLRHTADLRLVQRAKSYRVLFEENPAPMLVYEPASRAVLAINQSFTRIFGFTMEEIVGAPFGSLLVEQQRAAMSEAISRLRSEQIGPATSQWLVNTKNGQQRQVEVQSRPLEFAGKQARVVQMSDITDRLAAQETIRQREQLLHQIIENSPLPTVVLDAQQQVTDWNFALELLSRLPARNMVGKRHNLGVLIGTPDGGPILAECLLQGLDPDDPLDNGSKRGVIRSATLAEGIELEVFNVRLQRWTRSIAVPLRKPDGTLLGAIQSALDVTQLRETEAALHSANDELEKRVQLRTDELKAASEELQRAMQQLVQSEKLAALGGLVAGVAHELNTPIGNAMTVVTTLIDHLATFRAEVEANTLRRNQISSFIDTCSQACVMLERNTQRAAELVASFKQVAVDQTSMRRRQFSLREAVEETLLTVAPSYKHQPVVVTHDIPEALELNSFPGALEQAISTLVENAVIHARGNRPQLNIMISAQPVNLKGSPGVSISVKDDGVGMPPEVARRVFDPFFTTQLGQGGSGLGLYVVYSLVTGVLGGVINLSTQPGQGSCFTLVVPLSAPEAEPA